MTAPRATGEPPSHLVDTRPWLDERPTREAGARRTRRRRPRAVGATAGEAAAKGLSTPPPVPKRGRDPAPATGIVHRHRRSSGSVGRRFGSARRGRRTMRVRGRHAGQRRPNADGRARMRGPPGRASEGRWSGRRNGRRGPRSRGRGLGEDRASVASASRTTRRGCWRRRPGPTEDGRARRRRGDRNRPRRATGWVAVGSCNRRAGGGFRRRWIEGTVVAGIGGGESCAPPSGNLRRSDIGPTGGATGTEEGGEARSAAGFEGSFPSDPDARATAPIDAASNDIDPGSAAGSATGAVERRDADGGRDDSSTPTARG